MATNSKVSSRRVVREEHTDVALDGSGIATVSLPGLKHVDGVEDVSVAGYSIGGSTSGSGAVLHVDSIGRDEDGVLTVTLHGYQGGGADTQLADLTGVTVNSVRIEAEGL
jgi:hypothetical protein